MTAFAREKRIVIGVIGGESPPSEFIELSEEVGRLLARVGCTVISGGLGGIMEAVCRGASSEGGHTIGILPGDDPGVANAYVDTAIATGMGWARALALVHSSDAILAIDGAYGTLSEIAHALALGIPVVLLRSWSFKHEYLEKPDVVLAESPEDAVRLVIAAAKPRQARRMERMFERQQVRAG